MTFGLKYERNTFYSYFLRYCEILHKVRENVLENWVLYTLVM